MLAPLIRAMEARGDTVEVTAPRLRPDGRPSAPPGRVDPLIVGHHGGGGRAGKARAAGRPRDGASPPLGARPWLRCAALAHGSTDQPIVARAPLRVPATTMFDYEYAVPAALAQLPAGAPRSGARGRSRLGRLARYGVHGGARLRATPG